jgi:hypothetical protein
MIAIAFLFVRMLCDYFEPRQRLEAEILILRHQLNVLQQHAPRRALHLRWIDRALFIWLYRRCPRILGAMTIVRPETVVLVGGSSPPGPTMILFGFLMFARASLLIDHRNVCVLASNCGGRAPQMVWAVMAINAIKYFG